MQRGLTWSLGLTLLLAAWAQLWPKPEPGVVAAAERVSATPAQLVLGTVPGPPTATKANAGPLLVDPKQMQPWALEPARRDPFIALPVATRLATAPPSTLTAPSPPPPQSAPPPPQPAAPPVSALRYLGVLFNPNGERLLLLADGEAVVTAQPGAALPNGYVVQSVALDAVRVAHPPTGAAIDIALPHAARQKP